MAVSTARRLGVGTGACSASHAPRRQPSIHLVEIQLPKAQPAKPGSSEDGHATILSHRPPTSTSAQVDASAPLNPHCAKKMTPTLENHGWESRAW